MDGRLLKLEDKVLILQDRVDTFCLKAFNSDEERDDHGRWSRASQEARAKGHTQAEVDAVFEYVDSAAFHLNEALRANPVALDDFDTNLRKQLDLFLSRQSYPGGKVWRGVGLNFKHTLEGLKVGDVLIDKGFLSTSINRKVAEQYSVVMEIQIPKGARAAYISHMSTDPAMQEEDEVLVKRGSRLVFKGGRADMLGAVHTYIFELEK